MAVETIPRKLSVADYIHSKLDAPFIWGSNDCVTFVLGWVTIHTGIDHRVSLQPWTTEDEAVAAIKAAGGLVNKCNELFEPINPLMAKDGDIALIGRTVYLFSGSNIVGPGVSGLVFEDRMRAKCAWSYR